MVAAANDEAEWPAGKDAWWLDMVVFGIYQVTFIVMLFRMIQREDFADGPLPDRVRQKAVGQ